MSELFVQNRPARCLSPKKQIWGHLSFSLQDHLNMAAGTLFNDLQYAFCLASIANSASFVNSSFERGTRVVSDAIFSLKGFLMDEKLMKGRCQLY